MNAPRGRLSLFTGPVPGVGKTRRMLEEAGRLRGAGRDVVAAWVDGRRRPDVEALATTFERVTPHALEWRGMSAIDMDVKAVLARRPAVALVDDLAHVNAPGAPHSRRYQDVLALCEAGIDVLATVGVEHLDSLAELVPRLTGAAIDGAIPDGVFQDADTIVHVDASDDELLSRLDAGLFPAERSAAMRRTFYRPPALLAMRELSLRKVAEALARRQAPAVLGAQVSERVLVGLSSFSPRAMALLRRGARIAGRLNTDWFVVYVETPAEAPERLSPEIRRHLAQCVDKAKELGAAVHFVRSSDPVRALSDFARAHGVAHVVIGRSRRPWWRDAFGRSLVARLARETAGLDLHVLSMDEE